MDRGRALDIADPPLLVFREDQGVQKLAQLPICQECADHAGTKAPAMAAILIGVGAAVTISAPITPVRTKGQNGPGGMSDLW